MKKYIIALLGLLFTIGCAANHREINNEDLNAEFEKLIAGYVDETTSNMDESYAICYPDFTDFIIGKIYDNLLDENYLVNNNEQYNTYE